MVVENPEAATTNTTEANDVVMAEDTMEPAPNTMPEANEANDAPTTDVHPDASVDATAPVPPPRPHTIEQAFNYGQLITVKWPFLTPPPAAGPQFDYHVEHRPQVQKPMPRLPRFPGPSSAPGSFNVNGFKADNTFFNSTKNPYSMERISSDRFWSYPQ